MGRSTWLEIPDREKRGTERKGNFIIDLRCHKLFHSTVGPMDIHTCVIMSFSRSGIFRDKCKIRKKTTTFLEIYSFIQYSDYSEGVSSYTCSIVACLCDNLLVGLEAAVA